MTEKNNLEVVKKGNTYFDVLALSCAERCAMKLWKISGGDKDERYFAYMNNTVLPKGFTDDENLEYIEFDGGVQGKKLKLNKLLFMNALHREFTTEESKALIYDKLFDDIRKENNIPENQPINFDFNTELLIPYIKEEKDSEPETGFFKIVFVHYDTDNNRTDVELKTIVV